ncbi:hypothetical protein Lal_00018647 [Lupinus albus]|nr:hypothetical protein Lal_00018647 [Lupinus albus]
MVIGKGEKWKKLRTSAKSQPIDEFSPKREIVATNHTCNSPEEWGILPDSRLSERISPKREDQFLNLEILGVSPKRGMGRLSERKPGQAMRFSLERGNLAQEREGKKQQWRLKEMEEDRALCGSMELTQPKERYDALCLLVYDIELRFCAMTNMYGELTRPVRCGMEK